MKFKAKIFCALTCFLFVASLKAQINLVLNPSFEQLTNCPSVGNDADSARYWNWLNSACNNTPNYDCRGELFAACSPNMNWGVPYNFSGYQMPRTGSNYIALTSIYKVNSLFFNTNKRDYLKGQLSSFLQTGKIYCLTFYYNTCNNIIEATNSFGAYISNSSISSYDCCKNISINPQAKNNTSIFMTDTLNWIKIQGTFVALGNENTITLGNFLDSSQIQFQLFNSNGSVAPYYLIDDVSLVPTDLTPYAGRDTSITIGDSVYIGRPSEVGLDDDCFWYVSGSSTPFDTVAGLWIKPNTLGAHSYVVEQNICGTITYDTVNVFMNPVAIENFQNTKNIFVYPNPSTGEIYIAGKDSGGEQWNIEITDIGGRTVFQSVSPVSNNTVKVNTQLTNGVYFIKVITEDGAAKQQKIIINK